VLQHISKKFQIKNNEGNIKELDNILNTSLTGQEDIGVFIEKFDGTIRSTCKKSFIYLNSLNITLKGEPVSWRKDAFKIIK
jgi:hypothetical protein